MGAVAGAISDAEIEARVRPTRPPLSRPSGVPHQHPPERGPACPWQHPEQETAQHGVRPAELAAGVPTFC